MNRFPDRSAGRGRGGVSLASAVALGLGLVGCGATLPVGTAEQRGKLAAMTYPADAELSGTLDIAVQRRGREQIRLINREPRELRDVTLWLNREYVGVVERIGIGDGEPVALGGFVNAHGEAFPTGSPLTPDRAAALVSVERITPDGKRERMIVWPDARWYD